MKIYKIKDLASGNYLARPSYLGRSPAFAARNYAFKTTKAHPGKHWDTLAAVHKYLAKLNEAELKQLQGCEIVQQEILESTLTDTLTSTIQEMKLKRLEKQQQQIAKELAAVKKTQPIIAKPPANRNKPRLLDL